MRDLSVIEKYFKKLISNLNNYLPDGITEVDLDLLKDMDLLDFEPGLIKEDDSITRYFHVIESLEKITLINDENVVWIVPDSILGRPVTYVLIANNEPTGPELETAFIASGVYNNSSLVLRVLEQMLNEIQETQSIIDRYEGAA